ncbi:head-tail connector protein [Arenibacterium halophilum]|uniref:Phage gp6-like head-tail connector protein n=1 Tax=Arenibacterium halophilum TaxID=2583821 RepID=A0ABY2WWZ7_9RHOB|nr:phage head-tail connector protein [Arenibacterium halophilum]TMV07312.1 hypothetical protein FGK64_21915 [Arenibacterium halophilum]
MSVQTLVPPAAAVFDASDAILRQFLRLAPEDTGEDALIDEMIASATDQVETYIRRRLITQTVRITGDGFGPGAIALPIDPVQNVASVVYVDGAGEDQTLEPARYRLVRSEVPVELHPAYGESWPVPRPDRDCVRIDVVAGYGDEGTDVPAAIRAALRLLVAHQFFHREAVILNAGAEELPLGVRDSLAPYRFWV